MRYSTKKALEHFGDTPIIACEIGTLKGKNALEILENLNIKKLYIIDPYEDYIQHNKDITHLKTSKQIAHERLNKYKDKIIWIEKYSHDAVTDIEPLDFLYIDGNHYTPYVDNDIKEYYPLIKVNGIISGHDFSNGWEDVMFAVNSFFKNKEYSVLNRDWVVFK